MYVSCIVVATKVPDCIVCLWMSHPPAAHASKSLAEPREARTVTMLRKMLVSYDHVMIRALKQLPICSSTYTNAV